MRYLIFIFFGSTMSRRIVLTLFPISFSLIGISQIDKEQLLIGGNASYSYSKIYGEKTSMFSIAPAAGYFFVNRLAGGIRADFESQEYVNDRSKATDQIVSMVPFLRYYFLQSQQKINFFVDGGYGYSWGKWKGSSGSNSSTFKYHSNIISFKTGPALFLNEHTSIELTFGYNHSIREFIDTIPYNSFQVGVGFQIHLGKQGE